jgi:hypothetical protein
MSQRILRRKFISQSATAGLGICVSLLARCGQKKPVPENRPTGVPVDACDDLEGVPQNDVELRQKFAYVKKSPIPENECNNCNLYLPPGTGKECGACMLFKGPVYSSGYCTYWAPRV